MEVGNIVVHNRRHCMRSTTWWRHVHHPDQRRIRRIGNIPGTGMSGSPKSQVKPVVFFVHHGMVGVLTFKQVLVFSFFLTGQPASADKPRLGGIPQIPDLEQRGSETRLSCRRVKVASLGRPPPFMRLLDETATTARTARVFRCAHDLCHQRDLRWVGVARRDVEDLELEIFTEFRVPNQIVSACRLRVESVVIDDRHPA